MAKMIDAIDYVLGNEILGYDKDDEVSGGKINYTNAATDSGGPTKWGITQGSWREYFGRTVTVSDVQATLKYEAMGVYQKNYWHNLLLDKVDFQDVATCIFDIAVNCGPGTSIKCAQKALITLGFPLSVDGENGPNTLKALNSIHIDDFIEAFFKQVVNSYQEIVERNPAQQVNLDGWMNRAKKMLAFVQLDNGVH